MAKTFLGNLLGAIGQIFAGLFKAAQKAYNSLPQESKDAMIHGSGVISLINSMLDKAPDDIAAAIQKQFPNIKPKELEKQLFTASQMIGLTPKSKSLLDCLDSIKKHLASQKGKSWDIVSHSLSSGLSLLFAPKDTKLATVTSLIEYVYQHKIKKDQ